jgi:hypothetical protein
LKPYLRVFRGISKFNLPGYVGFFQFLRNFCQHNAFEQAELILQAALERVAFACRAHFRYRHRYETILSRPS